MTVGFLSISADTLYEVAELLDVDDIVNLGKVNKRLRQDLSSNRVWKRLTKKRWFMIDDIPFSSIGDVTDYYAYYRQRALWDCTIRDFLKLVADDDKNVDSSKIFDYGWRMLSMRHLAIPMLNEIRRTGKNLTVKYYASSVLTSIRHGELFQTLLEYARNDDAQFSQPSTCAEELFFKLSYMDPAFDNILPRRKFVIEKVIEMVPKHPSYSESMPNAKKVLIIAAILYKLVEKPSYFTPNLKGIEDYSILRVYAGEANGNKLIIESIIQKIASYFDIECSLTETFLTVKDVKGDLSYLLITEERQREFNHSDLLRALYQPDVLENLLQPLSTKSLLRKFFETTELSYCTKFASNGCNDTYRRSRISFHENIFRIFQQYYRVHSSHYQFLKEGNTVNIQDPTVLNEAGLRTMFQLLSVSCPFDVGLIPTSELINSAAIKHYKNYIIENFYTFSNMGIEPFSSEDLTPELKQPKLKIGEVVYHERSARYGIIVALKSSGKDVYYMILTDCARLYVLGEDGLATLEFFPPVLYDLITREPLVGLFFKSLDENSRKFIPTRHLKKLFQGFY